jgi:formimidoylglutamate deiminase
VSKHKDAQAIPLTNLVQQAWLPELVYVDGEFRSDVALLCDNEGRIVSMRSASDALRADPDLTTISLKNKAILPGLINAHSHAFQRVIRGRTEYRSQHSSDSFWTWRELMYRAANLLDPDDVYIASKMAFLEMALSGVTSVGEFHYLHRAANGQPYDDPNLLAKAVMRAANDVGLRIALLRVAYERAGFQTESNPLQVRFIEQPENYLKNLEQLMSCKSDMVWVGAAPHSVRAVSLDYLKEIDRFVKNSIIPIHMHVAEQPAEVSACIEEYGRSPVALLDTEGLLSENFTAVHAIHVTHKAIQAIAKENATVCACPTTERNLGDGVVPVDEYFRAGVTVSVGTDSQIQIDLLEDTRELEYHLRLQRRERNVLAPVYDDKSGLAIRLFECATVNGGKSIGFNGGRLEPGSPADFFTVDLNDPAIVGASPDNLLAHVVFSLSRTAVRDVVVHGKRIVEDGIHKSQEEIVSDFKALQRRMWT